MYCARCGRSVDERYVLSGLCIDCFLELNRLLCVPERLSFDYCRACGSVRLGYRWVEAGGLEEAFLTYLRGFMDRRVRACSSVVEEYWVEEIVALTKPSWRSVFRVRFGLRLRGVSGVAHQDYIVEAYASPTLCPLCKRARAGDYDVVVRLRGASPEKIASVLAPLLESDARLVNSILDVEEHRQGVDVFLLDKSAHSRIIRELRKRYQVNVKKAAEDVGVDSRGRPRRRLVLMVSLRERRRRDK